MSATIDAVQRKEQEMQTIVDEFQIVLCIENAQDRNELETVLRRHHIQYLTAFDIEHAHELIRSIEQRLTIFSFDFSGRRASDLIAMHMRLGDGSPFAFWTRDAVTDLENVVAVMRAGAVDVLHGTRCDAKMESLIAQARQLVKATYSNKSSNGQQAQAEPRPVTNGAGNSMLAHPQSGANGKQNGNAAQALNLPAVSTPRIEVRHSVPTASHRNGTTKGHAGESQFLQMIRGRSSAIEAIRNVIRHVAPTQATVMIHGESGTGKELVARAIHSLSKRAEQPFVPVNMAAIPNGLAESFLFGHEKGAFTSAVQKQKGWCRVAHGGTLFLDEIGEMELEIQPKLLRFLQEGSIQTVGAQSVEKVDVRLVTATNQDPREVVRAGRLREDLFFRLNVIPIYIPPLRDRCDDIEELAMLFLQRAADRHERPARGYTDEAMEVLVRHDWPGNVRQLENMVERLVIFAKGELVEAMEIPAEIHSPSRRRHFHSAESKAESNLGQEVAEAAESMECVVDRLSPFQVNERTVIIDALQRAEGHVIRAAQLLGLGQATMYRKIKQYAIPHQRKRRKATPR